MPPSVGARQELDASPTRLNCSGRRQGDPATAMAMMLCPRKCTNGSLGDLRRAQFGRLHAFPSGTDLLVEAAHP